MSNHYLHHNPSNQPQKVTTSLAELLRSLFFGLKYPGYAETEHWVTQTGNFEVQVLVDTHVMGEM